MQSARQDLCLQCEKTVAPDAVFSIEVKDDYGKVRGYLHRMGDCKAEWDKANPPKARFSMGSD
jgi:hypothetical protein